jgi:AhpD family alkylhydroperoxidase
MPFLGQIMDESSIDLATKELVILRVSQLNECAYCLAAHRPLALAAGLSEETVARVCSSDATNLTPREGAVLLWVDQVTLDPHGVTDELTAAMLDHVRDDQLIELTLLAGAISMLNAYCAALDIPPPETADD